MSKIRTFLFLLLIMGFVCVANPMSAKAGPEMDSSLSGLTAKNLDVLFFGGKLDETEVDAAKWSDNFTREDLKYMSCIIYCEAGSISDEAKKAVGNVVLNRMYDEGAWKHVSTIKDVIYDKGPEGKWGVQFTPAYSKSNSMAKALEIYKHLGDYVDTWHYAAMTNSIKCAKEVLAGKHVVPDTFMYFNSHVDSTKAKCKSSGRFYMIIDGQIYYE